MFLHFLCDFYDYHELVLYMIFADIISAMLVVKWFFKLLLGHSIPSSVARICYKLFTTF